LRSKVQSKEDNRDTQQGDQEETFAVDESIPDFRKEALVWIRKIKSSTGDLKIVSFEDTISKCISYSNPKQAFEFGKQLLATGNQIKIPRRLTFLKMYYIYDQASDEEKPQLREILGDNWTYFQRVASGLAEFVDIC
jgi:hypothetical protein